MNITHCPCFGIQILTIGDFNSSFFGETPAVGDAFDVYNLYRVYKKCTEIKSALPIAEMSMARSLFRCNDQKIKEPMGA